MNTRLPAKCVFALLLATSSNHSMATDFGHKIKQFNQHQVKSHRLAQSHIEAKPHRHIASKKFFFAPVETLADTQRFSGIKVGTAASQAVLQTQEQAYVDALAAEFNYITPENVAKWGSMQQSDATQWQFGAFDSMVAVASDNQQQIKGHALVWHRQAPAFINEDMSAEALATAIDNHIHTTLNHYKGEIYAWDVVNEAMGDDGNYRQSVFYNTLGVDYIADAFSSARAADPQMKLYYNDYGIAGINNKSDAVYQMLSELLEQGVPVDGIGLQMHLDASNAPSVEDMMANLQRFVNLGLSVNISELDVRVSSLPWDKTTNLAIQQQVYHRAAYACLKVRGCEAVTTWGFTDKYTWIDGEFGADDPLMLDESYQRKPAYYGLGDGLLRITPDDNGQLPNLIANGNMELGTDGWSTWGGQLSRQRFFNQSGKSSIKVSERSEAWQGAVYDVSDLVQASQAYDVSAWARVSKRFRDTVTLSARIVCAADDAQYIDLASDTGHIFRWKQLAGELSLPDCDLQETVIYVQGPAAGVNLHIDNVSLRPQKLTPNSEGYGDNLIDDSGFESEATAWFGFGDPIIELTPAQAYAGQQSLVATNRLDTWQGPAISLTDSIVPGASYQLFAWTSVSTAQAQVNATLRVTCATGDRYIGVGGTSTGVGDWRLLGGKVTVPYCDISDAVLYFEGPAAGIDIMLDDVSWQKKDASNTGNVVVNSDFEQSLAPWTAWGGLLALSELEAFQGVQSAALTNRTATWQGPVFDLLPFARANQAYSVNGFVKLEGVTSDSVSITVKTVCDGGADVYSQAGNITASDSEWSQLQGVVQLPECSLSQAFIYFDGPAVEANIYLDNVTIEMID